MVRIKVGYQSPTGEVIAVPPYYPDRIDFKTLTDQCQVTEELVLGMVKEVLSRREEEFPENIKVWWALTDDAAIIRRK